MKAKVARRITATLAGLCAIGGVVAVALGAMNQSTRRWPDSATSYLVGGVLLSGATAFAIATLAILVVEGNRRNRG